MKPVETSRASAHGPKTPLLDRFLLAEHEGNCCCPFTNPETVGYIFASSIPVGVTVMSNIFMQAAILELANRDAGCGYRYEVDDDDPPACDGTVYGMKPANVYNIIATISAVAVALMLPAIGAVVEHSSFRKEVAFTALAVLTLVQGTQIFINRATWFAMALLQVIAIAAFSVHGFAASSYLPELSNQQEELNRIGSQASFALFSTEVGFIVAVVILGSIIGFSLENNLGFARISQATSTVILTWSLVYIYGRLLRSRPKEPLGCCEVFRRGFRDLWGLYRQVRRDHPDMLRFLFGIMFFNSGMTAFATIAGVYLIEQLGASGAEVAAVILLLLIVGALTSPLAVWSSGAVSRRRGDAASAHIPLCASGLYIGLVTLVAPTLLQKPGDMVFAFVFAILWGLGFGHYYSLYFPCYFFLVPTGQEDKFSGLLYLCINVLGWAPIAMFTLLYRTTGDLFWGLFVMAGFILFGTGVLATVDMEKGQRAANDRSTQERPFEVVMENDLVVTESDL